MSDDWRNDREKDQGSVRTKKNKAKPNDWYRKLLAGDCGHWTKGENFVDEVTDPDAAVYCIYRIVNKVNGKCYIGFARDPERRWKRHIAESRHKCLLSYNSKFKRAIRKYGESVWGREILHVSCDSALVLNVLETFYIKAFDSLLRGYNSTLGGDGALGVPLTEQYICDRGEEYFTTNGRWPNSKSGIVIGGNPKDSWLAYDCALRVGARGLPGGSSLSDVFEKKFSVRRRRGASRFSLTDEQILERAMEHMSKTGKLPVIYSGKVHGGLPGDTWADYHLWLKFQMKGLTAGMSLPRFLSLNTGAPYKYRKDELTEDFISERVNDYKIRTGYWPKHTSGKVHGGADGDTWAVYHHSLSRGKRGLPGGSSLADLLDRRFGVTNYHNKPNLSDDLIIRRAVSHFRYTDRWPTQHSGVVTNGHPDDTWLGYHRALSDGNRGLPGGITLSKLLAPLKVRVKREGVSALLEEYGLSEPQPREP
jgi:hypothetical protein